MSKKKSVSTDILVVGVLDRSGSMSSCLEGAIEGWNDYLKDLQSDKEGETLVWLTGFDTEFEHWEKGTPVRDVPFLQRADSKTHSYPAFVPRGGTALYDAIANSIVAADAYLKKIGRDESSKNPMKVLHVTLSDGYENSSQEYQGIDGASKLRKLTNTYEDKGNWTFVYLGAEHDAWQSASAIGYSSGNVAFYSSSLSSNAAVADSLGAITRTNRRSASLSSPTLFADAGVAQDLTDEALERPHPGTVTKANLNDDLLR